MKSSVELLFEDIEEINVNYQSGKINVEEYTILKNYSARNAMLNHESELKKTWIESSNENGINYLVSNSQIKKAKQYYSFRYPNKITK